MITKTLGDLSENSNNQFGINRDFNEKINKIINTTNIIANNIKITFLLTKLRLLKRRIN